MNCGVALTPSLSVSSSTILPIENHKADLSRYLDSLAPYIVIYLDTVPHRARLPHSRPLMCFKILEMNVSSRYPNEPKRLLVPVLAVAIARTMTPILSLVPCQNLERNLKRKTLSSSAGRDLKELRVLLYI